MLSQRACQVAVDCLRFADQVLCELYGVSVPEDLPEFPRWDGRMGIDNPREAVRASLVLTARWRHVIIRSPDLCSLRPADVILCRISKRSVIAPTHVCVAGPNIADGELWHADCGTGVCRTSVGAIGRYAVRAWRPLGVNQEMVATHRSGKVIPGYEL
jgi:hypothetical protein